nr:MAG TPA: Putative Holin-like Toxin (Hol-Tox) [Caudoviricetes sp.]DAV17051.1 MAG TPA: Putative Holin-like Toxin (Hol-Tox) [Caudoviricetes sp.]
MEKPMKASVVPAKEQADRSVYEALAMMIQTESGVRGTSRTDGRA